MAEDLSQSQEKIFRVENKENERQKPIDALVVFGGGIISDKILGGDEEQGHKGMDMGHKIIGHPEQGWRLPLGAKLRALGAAELYLSGQVNDLILTGGPIKKAEGIEASEAQLMKKYLQHKLA